MSYFVLIDHILTNLVKFCLFQSYFAHIMSYLWYFFSWSISHQIDKVGQIVDAPPQPVTPRTIPVYIGYHGNQESPADRDGSWGDRLGGGIDNLTNFIDLVND